MKQSWLLVTRCHASFSASRLASATGPVVVRSPVRVLAQPGSPELFRVGEGRLRSVFASTAGSCASKWSTIYLKYGIDSSVQLTLDWMTPS